MDETNTPMEIKNIGPDRLQITFAGRLDLQSTSALWEKCIEALSEKNPATLLVDAKNVTYCDGAGIALLQTLRDQQLDRQKYCQIEGLPTDFQRLLDIITHQTKKACALEPKPKYSPIIAIGRYTADVTMDIRDNIIFLGEVAYQLYHACRNPRTIRWKDMWRAAEDVGPRALPLIIMIGFLMGLITSFQSAIPLGKFGAQIYIANLVGISMMRELGPLMTAVILAGRTASSFSAEIGTMKINQEVDALTTMGLNPIKFLTLPRMIATTLMTPLLSISMILFGLIGCAIVMNALGFNMRIFLQQLENSIRISDFIGGLIKTFVFGLLISGIGCLNGLKTKMGASSVGYSTTRAVVSSITTIIIVDGIFACVYYLLGV